MAHVGQTHAIYFSRPPIGNGCFFKQDNGGWQWADTWGERGGPREGWHRGGCLCAHVGQAHGLGAQAGTVGLPNKKTKNGSAPHTCRVADGCVLFERHSSIAGAAICGFAEGVIPDSVCVFGG